MSLPTDVQNAEKTWMSCRCRKILLTSRHARSGSQSRSSPRCFPPWLDMEVRERARRRSFHRGLMVLNISRLDCALHLCVCCLERFDASLQPLCRTLSIVAASLADPSSLCSNRCLESGSASFCGQSGAWTGNPITPYSVP